MKRVPLRILSVLFVLLLCAGLGSAAHAQSGGKSLTLHDMATRTSFPLRKWTKGESSEPLPKGNSWSLVFEPVPVSHDITRGLQPLLLRRGVWLDGDACAVIYARNPGVRSLTNPGNVSSILLPRLVNADPGNIATITLYERERADLSKQLDKAVKLAAAFVTHVEVRGKTGDTARARESVEKIRLRCLTIKKGVREKSAPVTAAQFEQAGNMLSLIMQSMVDVPRRGKQMTPAHATLLAELADEAQLVEKAFKGTTGSAPNWQQPPPETQPVLVQVFRQQGIETGQQAEGYFIYYQYQRWYRKDKGKTAKQITAMTPNVRHELAFGPYVFWTVPAAKPNSKPLALREKLDVLPTSDGKPLIVSLVIP